MPELNMGRKLYAAAWMSAASLVLTACSGGGGGSSSPPPPPPPTPPAGPTASVMADRSVVDERQFVEIDAGNSSDPSGANLSYEIEQIAGPQLRLAGGNGPQWVFNTEDVDTDTTVRFRVTVSFNGLSDSAETSVTIANFDRTPLSQQWSEEYGALSLEGLEVVQFDDSVFRDADRLAFLDADGDLAVATYQTDPNAAVEVLDTQILRDRRSTYRVIFDDLNLDTQVDVAVLDRGNDAVSVFRQTLDNNDGFVFEETGSGNFSDACALVSTFVGDDRPAMFRNEFPGLAIGSEGNGLGIFLNQGNPRPSEPTAQTLDEAGRFSALLSVTTGDRGCNLVVAALGTTGTQSVWAYDEIRSELQEFVVPVGTVPTRGRTVALGLGGQNIQLIDMDSGIGQDGQGFIVMLFGRGHYDSNLLVVLQEEAGEVTQSRIDLPNGFGSDLLVDNVDFFIPGNNTTSDVDSDILIASPDTPYVYVLENLSSNTGTVTFSEVQYLEVGFGVTRVGLVRGDDAFGPELALADESPRVRLFRNAD